MSGLQENFIQINTSKEILNKTYTENGTSDSRKPNQLLSVEANIVLYSIIFLLSVCGNVLVILTLTRVKRMHTITNLFLLNLAVSDLLLSVLCMPFSLVAFLLKDFIFGEPMCILMRYFQAVSVGVNCFTLVVISLERYYAICQPLRSRRWQTLAHARRMLVGIWLSVLLLMSPIAAFNRLLSLRTGASACREIWPQVLLDNHIDKAYNILLVIVLLLVPLVLMSGFYGIMGKRLWLDIGETDDARRSSSSIANELKSIYREQNWERRETRKSFEEHCHATIIRSYNYKKDIRNRKRVIRMLFVIVMQYFICWTPLYVLNAWQSIDFLSVFKHISPTAKSFILLLAYTSSFIHPITYCFMNTNFRQGFLTVFHCRRANGYQPASRTCTS